jgi:hypothetical protein
MSLVFGRDADAGVTDADDGLVAGLFNLDRDASPLGRVLDHIVQQIDEYLPKTGSSPSMAFEMEPVNSSFKSFASINGFMVSATFRASATRSTGCRIC